MTPTRTFATRLPVDLRRTLAPLVASRDDPTIRLRDDGVQRALWTPDGAAVIEVVRLGDDPRRFQARAWGSGAAWALEQAPAMVGAHDDLDGFHPSAHPRVARAHRERPGLRVVRTGLVADVLVRTILEQRVTGREATRSWLRLVRRFGSPAPGPTGLRLPPAPAALAAVPDWTWRELGVDRGRARTAVLACRRLHRLQEAVAMPPPQAQARLCALPGIGPWTAALVLRIAAGHADAVEVGDFHVKHHVGWNLAGEARASDERMLDLLAPFAGHRGRVVRLLLSAGQRAPAFGPRKRIVPVESL